MFLKIHKSYRNVVAVCDSDLIGKRFEQGDFQLDVRENFYKGEELGEEEIIKIMRHQTNEDATFNIIGKESVEAAIKAEIINPESASTIQGIPFAFVLI